MTSKKLQRILVGLDGDDLARFAVDRAAELAPALGARAHFAHAVPEWSSWTAAPSEDTRHAQERAELDARERCLAFLRGRLAEDAPLRQELEGRLIVAPSHPAKLLLEQAERLDTDVILLGAHRERKLFDFGNTARAVLANAPCPVWVQADEPRPIRRMLVPVESAEEGRKVVDLARALAEPLGAAVTILHCFVPPDFAWTPHGVQSAGFPTYVVDDLREQERAELEGLIDSLREEGFEPASVFAEGTAVQQILDHQADFDLIVMGTHGRGRFSKEVLGSVAYGVLRDAEVGVVVVPVL